MKSWLLAKNVLRRVVQDPRTVGLVLLTPLLFILLYGFSFTGGQPTQVALAVTNQDNGLASLRTESLGRVTLELGLGNQLVQGLRAGELELIEEQDPQAARQRVETGGAAAALLLPKNFSHALANVALRISGPRAVDHAGRSIRVLPPEEEQTPVASLYVEDSNPVVSSTIVHRVQQAMADLLAAQGAAPEVTQPFQVELIYGGEVSSLDYTAPGIIGFAMTLITVMLTAISIVRERTGGTLTRILVAPVRAWEVTTGYTLAFTLICLVQVAELFVASHFLFHIRFVGSPAVVALVIVVYAAGLQGMATLLSAAAKNEFQAVQFVLVLLIPAIMLSGVFWPLEAMPPAIRALSYASPLTYANTALREVMLRGGGLDRVAVQVGVLAGLALVSIGLGVHFLRRQASAA
ncbi:MAG: ABC transporter permease [Candidatus Bipolaricaulaceae bacterium]